VEAVPLQAWLNFAHDTGKVNITIMVSFTSCEAATQDYANYVVVGLQARNSPLYQARRQSSGVHHPSSQSASIRWL